MFGKEKKLVMCQNCRALVDPSENVCPLCGNESVPERRVAVATDSTGYFSKLILTVNVILFILMGYVGYRSSGSMESFFASAPSDVLQAFGSLVPPLVKQGELWRLVTPNFLHIGILHILVNSYSLSQVGPIAEESFGEQKFIFIYLLTGILSCIASVFFGIGGAGASGALFGLIGLLAAYGYRQGGVFGKGLMRSMLIWGGINIMIGFGLPGINNVAHIGGLISGGLLGLVIKGEPPQTVQSRNIWNVLAVVSILVIIGSFVIVGTRYGAMQQKQENKQAVLRLSRLVGQAGDALNNALDVTDEKSRVDAARKLRGLASDISGVKEIDERSTSARAGIIAILNKRADTLEQGGKNPQNLPAATAAEMREAEQAFAEYEKWEDSVLENYGLYKTTQKPK